jgi:hypothetical protein
VIDQSQEPDDASRRFSLRSALAICATAAPAALILYFVLRYGIAIPMLDDWEMVPPVVKAHTGTLTFTDLFAQQQEARTFFPRLIFIALSFAKHWDGRAEMVFGILVCCLTSVGIYRLLAKSGLSWRATILVFLMSMLLIFSPAQHELWLLASGFPSFIPALCVVWSLCVIRSGRSTNAKFWICAGLAVFASFTLANGLLVWALTFPVLFVIQPDAHWKRWLGFWLLAAAVCGGIYFWNFEARSDLPRFAPQKPLLDYWRYVTAFLGSSLGRSGNDYPLGISIGVGATLLTGYFASLGWFFFRCRDRKFCARVAPWIALGAYSVGSGILASLGRIEWGVAQALESRYVAFSLYLAVATIAIAAIFITELFAAEASGTRRRTLFVATAFLVLTCFTLELLCAAGSIPFFKLRSSVARLGQSGVLFNKAFDTSKTITSTNYPRPFFVRENAEKLEQLNLLRTPLIRTCEINKLRHGEVGQGFALGWLDGLTTTAEGFRMASGWAALPGRARPADGVLLAYADAGGAWIAFMLSDAVLDRPDVARTLGSSAQLWSGWRAIFSPNALPLGAEISAWGIDAKEAKVYRLKSTERMFNR